MPPQEVSEFHVLVPIAIPDYTTDDLCFWYSFTLYL